jgi:hypothetical protein
MAKPQKSKSPIEEAELHPDAWNRFERAVDLAAKRSPSLKVAKPQKAMSRSKATSRKAHKTA